MNTLTTTLISFVKNHKKLLVGVLIVLGAGTWYFIGRSDAPEVGATLTVERTTLVQEVSVTGSVKAASTAELSFEKSGRVARVYAREGASVAPGQLLAVLANGDLAADALAAEADVAREKATLAELLRGARDEDIRVKEAEVASAEQTLSNYYNDIKETLEDAYAKVDDATRTKLSGVYSVDGTTYKLSFTACNAQDENDAKWQRYLMDGELATWRTEIAALQGANTATQETALRLAKGHVDAGRELLETTNRILTASCTITNTALDTYRTNTSTARAALNTAASSLEDLEQNIKAQKLTIEQRRRELDLKKAAATPEAIAAAQANVARADARLQAARVELGKTEIRSPLSGTLTKMDAEPGELMLSGTPVATVISSSQFEMEAHVPEADIAKLAVGNTADVTLDAYGDDEVFAARVYFIDPAETVVDGVPTYRVKLQFTGHDQRIKSGMTANIRILALKKENVLAIPQRSITQTGTTKTVTVVAADGTLTPREITTGMRGSDGTVEILTGLAEGDVIDLSVN